MTIDNGMLIGNLAMGPLLLFFAVLFKVWPPKNRNHLYGYRTTRSLKSDEAWKAANEYANELMLSVAVFVVTIQVVLYILVTPKAAFIWGSILMCTLLILTIPIVESFLKKHFDEKGNRKS